MPIATDAVVRRMRDQLFFEGPDLSSRLSRFWLLLLLATVIASAGVVADSTATVIGAMIVAPLMVPILGTVVAVVLADRTNVIRSLALVVTGAAAVVAIGYVLGLFVDGAVVAATNPQVASRVSPDLVDLVAALATGAVGSVALARDDISDTLPGVAIAISLVPPLAVVGLTLESGAPDQSLGALLLFGANMAAILATGLLVMSIYRVHRIVTHAEGGAVLHRRRAAVVIVVALGGDHRPPDRGVRPRAPDHLHPVRGVGPGRLVGGDEGLDDRLGGHPGRRRGGPGHRPAARTRDDEPAGLHHRRRPRRHPHRRRAGAEPHRHLRRRRLTAADGATVIGGRAGRP